MSVRTRGRSPAVSASPLRLALLGDSIAVGQGATRDADTPRVRLVEGLAAEGIDATARVFAVSGSRSSALRRQVDRALPWEPDLAVIVIAIKGEEGSGPLLVLSQVILSLQLPFAIFPLVQFTSSEKMMGPFVSKFWIKALAWPVCVIIAALTTRNARRILGLG